MKPKKYIWACFLVKALRTKFFNLDLFIFSLDSYILQNPPIEKGEKWQYENPQFPKANFVSGRKDSDQTAAGEDGASAGQDFAAVVSIKVCLSQCKSKGG